MPIVPITVFVELSITETVPELLSWNLYCYPGSCIVILDTYVVLNHRGCTSCYHWDFFAPQFLP
jgi:hypothetical protein